MKRKYIIVPTVGSALKNGIIIAHGAANVSEVEILIASIFSYLQHLQP